MMKGTDMKIRRLLAVTAVAATALLAACGTATNSAVATAAGYASTIAGGLNGALPTIASITGINPSTVTQIRGYIAELQVAAGGLRTAASNSAAQPFVQQVETDVNSIVASLSTIPVCGSTTASPSGACLPADVNLALQAAQVLLPPIEQVIGMVATPKTQARALAIPMSPATAECILKNQAGQSC